LFASMIKLQINIGIRGGQFGQEFEDI
jgi:hypothetical protein